MAQVTDDERLLNINAEKQQAVNEINNQYTSMINQTDDYYNQLVQSQDEYAQKQSEIQQQQSDLAIEKIDNAQAQAQKDYEKEQKASYVDYMQQQRGANQTMLNAGQYGSGYSETNQASIYNQYQNRVATARESYNQTVADYEVAKKDAILQNSSALMEIAYNTQQEKLQLLLEGFQYKNTLLQNQISTVASTEDRYDTKWQNMLSQINTEKELEESIREYNESMAYQKERDAVSDAQWQKEYELSLAQLKASTSSGYTYSDGSSSSGTTSTGSTGTTTSTEATNANQSNTVSTNTLLYSVSTPTLSNKKAQQQFSKYFKKSSYTVEEFSDALDNFEKYFKLSQADENKIIDSYKVK